MAFLLKGGKQKLNVIFSNFLGKRIFEYHPTFLHNKNISTCMNSEMDCEFGFVMEFFVTKRTLMFADFMIVKAPNVQC